MSRALGRRHLPGLAAAAALLPPPARAAAAWPEDRPIRMIVPIAQGGSTDAVARLLAAEIGAVLHQQIVVENRPGAAGQIGMRAAAQAAPDGYTLLLATTGHVAVAPAYYANPGYDSLRDFVPVALIMESPVVLVARAGLPVRSPAELAALMRRDPKAVTFASPGAGQTPHLLAEIFRRRAGTDTPIATYRGGSPAAMDLLAGHVDAQFVTVPVVIDFIRNGQLRALAVTGRQRFALLPGLPTMAESGFDGFERGPRFMLLAPAGAPQAVVARVNALARAALEKPGIRDRLLEVGAEPLPASLEETVTEITAEVRFWHDVIHAAGIHAGS